MQFSRFIFNEDFNDENIDEIFKILPNNAFYYLCKPSIERGMSIKEIIPIIKKYQLNYLINSSPKEALANARKNAFDNDLIYVGGSTFICADLIQKNFVCNKY